MIIRVMAGKKKVTFPSQFLDSFFFFLQLNFLKLCQLLGKWEGKEEKNSECGNCKQVVLAALRPESAVGSWQGCAGPRL